MLNLILAPIQHERQMKDLINLSNFTRSTFKLASDVCTVYCRDPLNWYTSTGLQAVNWSVPCKFVIVFLRMSESVFNDNLSCKYLCPSKNRLQLQGV